MDVVEPVPDPRKSLLLFAAIAAATAIAAMEETAVWLFAASSPPLFVQPFEPGRFDADANEALIHVLVQTAASDSAN